MYYYKAPYNSRSVIYFSETATLIMLKITVENTITNVENTITKVENTSHKEQAFSGKNWLCKLESDDPDST